MYKVFNGNDKIILRASNDFLVKLSYKKPDGSEVESSNRGKEYLSMYRLAKKSY